MSNLKGIKLKQLSQALKEGRSIPVEGIGQRVKDIREALGMTQKQLAKRIGIKQPLLSRIEDDAASCALKTVWKIAKALECEFMGVFISKELLEAQINKQAMIKAKKIVRRTFANMAMEQQAPNAGAYGYQIKKIAEDLSSNPGPELWEE